MSLLKIHAAKPKFSSAPQIGTEGFTIHKGDFWTILGSNGSGKSLLAKTIAQAASLPPTCIVSFEEEQRLLEREIYEDDSEWIDKNDPGRTTRELIEEHRSASVSIDQLITTFALESSIDTGFKLLSTGERRKLMLARALSHSPSLLILDEPYDGIDATFAETLRGIIDTLAADIPTVLITNRHSEISAHTTHIACLHELQIIFTGTRKEAQEQDIIQQLYSHDYTQKPFPSRLKNTPVPPLDAQQATVKLQDITVAYHNKTVLEHLNWTIHPHQHWRVSGPNGCGKSTLVNLISGDHPQCYSNTIYLFGKKRGIGESIWDVKHWMGLMSTALHQQYRVTVTAETVVLSGFFDTIGVYRPVTAEHKKIATQWLEYLGLSHKAHTHFHALSFGQQRMLLIARALIKQPRLLILDEPCQGLDPLNRALVTHLIETIIQTTEVQLIYISHAAEDTLACLTHEISLQDTRCGILKKII